MYSAKSLLKKINHLIKNNIYVIYFGVVYLAWNYTAFIRSGGTQGLFDAGNSTLDASWMIGLNWATQLHLNWAADNLVFTYGPLYYFDELLLPEFHHYQTLLIVHFGMNLLFVACFAYIFSLFNEFFSRTKNMGLIIIVTALLLLQKPNILLLPLFVAFVSLPIIFSQDKIVTKPDLTIRYIRYGVVTLILAFIPFVKFSHIYESVLLIIVLALFSLYRRRYLDTVLVCSLFIIFSIMIWRLATGEGISVYLSYLQTRFMVSSGYTEAMMIDFTNSTYFSIFVLALLYLAMLGLVLIYLIYTKRIDWMMAWLLPLIPLFLGFKSSFVRADGHTYLFLTYIFLSGLYYYYLFELNRNEEMTPFSTRMPLAQAFVPFLAIIVISSYSFLGGGFKIKNEFLDVQELLKYSPQTKLANQSMSREAINKVYNLDSEFLRQLDKRKTTDVIPWDIALLYANNLVWMPRPILQSYASYTSELDALDAEFFRKSNSPKQLIVSLATIDQRHILFDNPATFRVLLDSYRFVTQSSNGQFALFKRLPEPMFRDLVLINQKEYSFSEEIMIPKEENGHVFMFIEIEPTFVGKLLNILYKPAILSTEITLKNSDKRQHRIIRSTANNGLFVSKYVENLHDLEMVFNEEYDQNITSVRFFKDGNGYKDSFKVSFYELPFK